MRVDRFLPFLVLPALVSSVGAQVYSTPRPVVRTTSLPALRAIALRREVHERFAIGLAEESKADWSEAAGEFEAILALRPAEPQGSTARYDLAIAYANLRRFDDAASELRSALAADPGFLAAMANLIAVDLARGDLREARAIADRFVAAAPDSARALYSRGIVALRSGDLKTARADFGTLLHFNPSYALAYYDLGIAEVRLGRLADAQRDLTAALTLAPAYARARFALAVVLLKEGDRAGARAAFERAATDAGGDLALRNLALAMSDAIRP